MSAKKKIILKKINAKKINAQASMEFMMTYGWAILVVLAAIGVVAYFGANQTKSFSIDRCILQPGIACQDFEVKPSYVNLILLNSLDKDIILKNITIGNCFKNLDYDLGSQFNVRVKVDCSNGKEGDKFRSDIRLVYVVKDSGFTKVNYGTITTRVK